MRAYSIRAPPQRHPSGFRYRETGAQQGKPHRPATRLAREAFYRRKDKTTHSGFAANDLRGVT